MVCTAETTLHTALQGALDAIKSKGDAASQKQDFVDFFSGLPGQLKTLERAIKTAGAPSVPNGKAIAKTGRSLDTSGIAPNLGMCGGIFPL